jgi:hypothetical protein
MESGDLGKTWSDVTIPVAKPQLNAIECPSVATCYATGQGWDSPIGGLVLLNLDANGITVNSTPLPGAVEGSPYSQSLSAIGGTRPYSWTVTSGALPAGLGLNASTGMMTGVPTTFGTFAFTVTATDSSSPSISGSLNESLTVEPSSVLMIETSSLPSASVGSLYSQTLTATGGNAPYTWMLANGTKLPKGLKLNKSTGVISGTPSKKSTGTTFTVQVNDTKVGKPKKNSSATATFTIGVSP